VKRELKNLLKITLLLGYNGLPNAEVYFDRRDVKHWTVPGRAGNEEAV
jgi:hypothetical protein